VCVNSDDIEARAAAWFARRESGTWTAADQRELEVWLEAATAHRVAYVRITTAWERSGRLSALGAGVPAGVVPSRDGWGFGAFAGLSKMSSPAEERNAPVAIANGSIRAAAGLRKFGGKAAASVAALLVAGAIGLWYFSSGAAPVYTTSVGAISTLPLADGSQITLNTDSQVRVDLRTSERHVELARGEAYFAVAKQASRPFVVDAGDARVIAVGTQFSVWRESNELRVMVAEGGVTVQRRGLWSATSPVRVEAGSEARITPESVRINPLGDMEDLLSWRTGYLQFRDTPLTDAVAEFNRYSSRKIRIDDPAIADLRVGGHFRLSDVDTFLGLLRDGFPIDVEPRGNLVVLTKR